MKIKGQKLMAWVLFVILNNEPNHCFIVGTSHFCPSSVLEIWASRVLAIRPYQIFVTFFNFFGTLPKIVVQLPIQFATKIF